ncbi:MAG TPA: MFS transporter [Candidatus Dormibacteraeota bacterium]|nr:MFS transporter [Candidatus Dormibacteraeota bacterium]
MWLGVFTTFLAFSFVFPFLPIFIGRDLHVAARSVPLWSGIVGGAAGAALAVTSPLWGMAADRWGRKGMLLRAMISGCILVALMGFSQNVYELAAIRFLQGGLTGIVAAATALVAAETPRPRVGWALGVLSSGIASGTAIGPFIGGLIGAAFGMRRTCIAAGVLLLLATIPVIVMVRERPLRNASEPSPPAIALLRSHPGAVRAVAVLVLIQGLIAFGYNSTQQLVVIRLLRLAPTNVATLTGIAFGLSGLAAAAAGIAYGRVAGRKGYRWTAIAGGLGFSASILVMAIAPSWTVVVGMMGVFGFLYGSLSPTASSMLGLEAPRAIQARVFGIGASSLAVGSSIGPISCGAIASATNPTIGLIVAASSALVIAGLMLTVGREPGTPALS